MSENPLVYRFLRRRPYWNDAVGYFLSVLVPAYLCAVSDVYLGMLVGGGLHYVYVAARSYADALTMIQKDQDGRTLEILKSCPVSRNGLMLAYLGNAFRLRLGGLALTPATAFLFAGHLDAAGYVQILAVTLLLILTYASLGLAAALQTRRQTSILVGMLFAFLHMFVSAVQMPSLNPIGMSTALLTNSPLGSDPASFVTCIQVHCVLAFTLLGLAFLAHRRSWRAEGLPRRSARRARRPRFFDHPILYREWGRPSLLLPLVVLGCALVSNFWLVAMLCLTAVLCARAFYSSQVSLERERQTGSWDALLGTALRPRQILAAKALCVLVPTWLTLGITWVAVLPIVGGVTSEQWPNLQFMLMGSLLAILFCCLGGQLAGALNDRGRRRLGLSLVALACPALWTMAYCGSLVLGGLVLLAASVLFFVASTEVMARPAH